jgi:hypothetical protein
MIVSTLHKVDKYSINNTRNVQVEYIISKFRRTVQSVNILLQCVVIQKVRAPG